MTVLTAANKSIVPDDALQIKQEHKQILLSSHHAYLNSPQSNTSPDASQRSTAVHQLMPMNLKTSDVTKIKRESTTSLYSSGDDMDTTIATCGDYANAVCKIGKYFFYYKVLVLLYFGSLISQK